MDILRSSRDPFPEQIAALVNEIGKDRGSPGPSLDEVWQDLGLENLEIGTGEPEVEDPEMVANVQGLLYPFVSLEFNADGSGRLN